MIVDLHIHTMVSSLCSRIDPEELVRKARDIGLDAIAVTEHGELEGARVVKEIAAAQGFTVFEGMEALSREGHLLVFGYPHKLAETLPAREVVARVSAAGGIVIPAHPYRSPFGWYTSELKDPSEDREFAELFTVVEMYNGLSSLKENKNCERMCAELGKFGTGGSDAHRIENVGCCVTVFDADDITDERRLVEELKKGRFAAKINANYSKYNE